MKLGIVVLHWRNVERTASLLQDLFKWYSINPTIILVQNESTEDSFTNIEGDNIIKLFAATNLGFSGGCNLGIEASIDQDFDYTLLLNTDAAIDEKEVLKLLNHIDKNATIFSIGPKLIEKSATTEHTYVGGRNIAHHINTRIKIEEVPSTSNVAIEVPYTIGAIILLSNKHLKEVGPFDAEYFFSGEVADLCYRAHQMDLKSVTLMNATGYHNTEDSDLRETLYKYYSLRNRFLFIRKRKLDKKYLYNWYKLIFKEFLHGIITLDLKKTKTMYFTIIDVLLKRTGNRNKLFIT